MSKILDSFDIGVNFWEVHPQFKSIEPFKSLYKEDKKNKQLSSSIMWFVSLVYDIDSQFYNIEEEEKQIIIGKDYCGDEAFYKKNQEAIDKCAEMYIHIIDTPAEKVLREWDNKMMERAKFIKNTPYTEDMYQEINGKTVLVKGSADLLDKMMKNTKSMYDDLKRIKEELSKEQAQSQGRGGKVASLSDSGEI